MVNSPPASDAGPLLDGKLTSESGKVVLLEAVSRLFACAASCCTMPASPSTVCCKLSTCSLRMLSDETPLAAAVEATGVSIVGSRRRGRRRALVDSSRAGVARGLRGLVDVSCDVVVC